MSDANSPGYLRTVDFEALQSTPAGKKYKQLLVARNSGDQSYMVRYQTMPPGASSAGGMHVHDWEQVFYVITGVMDFEVGGEKIKATPASLVAIPPGVPHKHWNSGEEGSVVLMINTPLPNADNAGSQST